LVVPLTVAVNVWVCEPPRETVDGVIEIVTAGNRLTMAVANLLESAVLVAFTVTDWALLINEGAV
jgi:hypothetical protein